MFRCSAIVELPRASRRTERVKLDLTQYDPQPRIMGSAAISPCVNKVRSPHTTDMIYHVSFLTVSDGWGPMDAKHVGHRPSPRSHSGVLGFTLGEVLAHVKLYWVPTSAHMAACAEKACTRGTATSTRACCSHSTSPWQVLAWLFKPLGRGTMSKSWTNQDSAVSDLGRSATDGEARIWHLAISSAAVVLESLV